MIRNSRRPPFRLQYTCTPSERAKKKTIHFGCSIRLSSLSPGLVPAHSSRSSNLTPSPHESNAIDADGGDTRRPPSRCIYRRFSFLHFSILSDVISSSLNSPSFINIHGVPHRLTSHPFVARNTSAPLRRHYYTPSLIAFRG